MTTELIDHCMNVCNGAGNSRQLSSQESVYGLLFQDLSLVPSFHAAWLRNARKLTSRGSNAAGQQEYNMHMDMHLPKPIKGTGKSDPERLEAHAGECETGGRWDRDSVCQCHIMPGLYPVKDTKTKTEPLVSELIHS